MKTEACCYLNLFSEQLFVLTLFIYTYLLFSLLYFASSFDMKCDFYQYFTVAFSGEKIKTVSEIFKSYFHLSTEQIVW